MTDKNFAESVLACCTKLYEDITSLSEQANKMLVEDAPSPQSIKDQYFYSFDGENYSSSSFDTIDKAIEEGKFEAKELEEAHIYKTRLYIGKLVQGHLLWDNYFGETIVNNIIESTGEEIADITDYFEVTDTELESLDLLINNAISTWIDRYNLESSLYVIDMVCEVDI